MSKAGYLEEVYVKVDATSVVAGDKVDGILDFSFSRTSDIAETTDTKDGTGYKSRMQLLKDSSIDMSGQYEAADAPQILLRASYLSGATVYVTVYVDPAAASLSKGWRLPCLVESYDSKGAVNGVAEFSCKLVGNGAPTAV